MDVQLTDAFLNEFVSVTTIEKRALSLAPIRGGLQRAGQAVSQGISRITGAGSTAANMAKAAPIQQAARTTAAGPPSLSLVQKMKAMPGPAIDPEVVGAAQQQAAYHRLPFRVKHMVNKTPLVRAGVPAPNAAAIAGWGAGRGEDYAGAVARTAMMGGGVAAGPQGRAARSAARMARRQVADAATKVAHIELAALLDELVKISAAHGRWKVPQSRSGRRSMRVSTLLRKEKEGSLYKGGAAGSEQARLEYQEIDPKATGRAAAAPPKSGDVPSRDEIAGKPVAQNRQEARFTNISQGSAPEGYVGY